MGFHASWMLAALHHAWGSDVPLFNWFAPNQSQTAIEMHHVSLLLLLLHIVEHSAFGFPVRDLWVLIYSWPVAFAL